jgi:hypothetical protein
MRRPFPEKREKMQKNPRSRRQKTEKCDGEKMPEKRTEKSKKTRGSCDLPGISSTFRTAQKGLFFRRKCDMIMMIII